MLENKERKLHFHQKNIPILPVISSLPFHSPEVLKKVTLWVCFWTLNFQQKSSSILKAKYERFSFIHIVMLKYTNLYTLYIIQISFFIFHLYVNFLSHNFVMLYDFPFFSFSSSFKSTLKFLYMFSSIFSNKARWSFAAIIGSKT